MKTRALNFLFGLMVVLAVRSADPLTDALQKGLLEEEVHRDLNAAAAAYEAAVRHADTQRAAAATAVFRLAETYRKLGRTNDAVALYRRILDQFGDQAPLADLSRTNLSLLLPGQPGAAPAPSAASTAEEAAELQRLRVVIRNSPDLVNARDATTDGGTPLHHAAAKGYLNVVEFLLDHGAEVNAQDNSRRRPLHHAAEAGHKRVCEVLLARGADVNSTDATGNTPLHLAVENGYLAVAETLLVTGAEVDVQRRSSRSQTRHQSAGAPLHLAAEKGFIALVDLLLRHGAEIHATDEQGMTPLIRAIAADQPAAVKRLLEKGANPNAPSTGGFSPLADAVSGGQVPLVRLLLDHGADLEARIPAPEPEGDWTVLFRALGMGEALYDVEMVRFLLDAGANANASAASGITPVHWVVLRWTANRKVWALRGVQVDRVVTLLRLLRERRADVNARDSGGNTPLHYAIEAGSPELVEALLAAGADPNAPGWNGGREKHWPPLLAAVRPPPGPRSSPPSGAPGEGDLRQTQLVILGLLLKHGADVNGRLTNGWTALHRAVQLDRADVAQLLLAHRAEVNPRGALPKSEPVLGPRRAAGATSVMDLSLGELASEQEPNRATPRLFDPRLMYWYQFDLCTESAVTPLHVAVWYNNEEMLRWLIEHGAEVNARTAAGRSPLLVAVDRLMQSEIVRLLLRASADPNAADATKMSPMHLALKLSRLNEQAAPKLTPACRAFLRQYGDEIVPLLREHGGKAPPEP